MSKIETVKVLKLNAFQTKRPKGRWVGMCDDLDIVVEADNLEELISMFQESVELLFEDLMEKGDLDQFLSEKGWGERYGSKEKPTEFSNIPIDLLASIRNNNNDIKIAVA